jgi:hypothetical protein
MIREYGPYSPNLQLLHDKLAAGDSKNGEQLPLPYSDLLILIYLVDKNLWI